ncbi:uncharacterized protein involved in cysteine biosynthesis [Sinomonas atrocyanea]|uniref:hypothetical protein n=1 Tax=Sinomonas atrocyanea TaxID=37927 RepID=UPI002783C31E|nr:hypothetical protein [Sinomonas atrocyanea]MDP9884472.1 uncharacterized protein involved in cysteine biosynthesis [Sinomonas atrocyanea]
MYRALWRSLPGPVLVRVLVLALMVAVLLIVLDQWVFPWLAATFVDDQTTIGRGA